MLGLALEPTDVVFSHLDSKPLRPDSATRAFHRLAEEGIRFRLTRALIWVDARACGEETKVT